MDPQRYLRHTLDPVRLAILGSAATGAVDAGLIAEAMEVDRKHVLRLVSRLTEDGLIEADGGLNIATIRDLATRLGNVEVEVEDLGDTTWNAEERKVLRSFFEGSRLRQVPAQRSKRRIVLERLAQEFDPGVRYPERQVSFTLQLVHPDYAALRRYLVDEGFLTRSEGVYWRTGGRYETSADELPSAGTGRGTPVQA